MNLHDVLNFAPVAWLVAVGWALVAFATSFLVRRHAIIDVFWGSGFLVVYLASLYAHGSALTSTQIALLVVVAIWSLRLTFYLAWRQRGSAEDTRYVAILANTSGRNDAIKALKVIYLLQGTLLWLVSFPLQWVAASTTTSSAFLVWCGVVLALVGTAFEAVGDDQLRRFIAQPANHGTTMNRGLWRYTRHPNYFGEAVLWTGFFLVAAGTPWGWATVPSAALMIYLVTALSGKPMLERKLTKTRTGYEDYVATTSAFFPRRPRKVQS
jgi:steroid 5-alpha reductase family enzyme